MVLEIPPADDGSITGTIMDGWQMALEDVGPAGVDNGKYLILPPGYKDKAPEGDIVLPSQTYQGYALLRSILKSRGDSDIAKAVGPTAGGSSSILFPPRRRHRGRLSSTRSTSWSPVSFLTMSASSSRSTAWCSTSPGWNTTAR